MREGAALQIGEGQLVVAGLAGQFDDLALDLGEALAVGVAHDRHDQPFFGADGDADVVVVLEHHLVALDLGVDAREGLQRADTGFGEERHEAEADAVPLLEIVAAALAQLHHRAHIDLVEGRQHRGGVLRLDQPRGDRLAAARHAHALLAAPFRQAGRCGAGRRTRHGDAAGCGGRRRRARGGVRLPAAAGRSASMSSGSTRPPGPLPLTLAEINAALGGHAPHGWAGAAGVGCRRRSPAAAASGPLAELTRRGRRCLRLARTSARSAPASMVPSTSPTATVSPSCLAMLPSTPACSAGTSTLTLSVSSSTSGSLRVDRLARCLSHFTMTASTIDSPRVGTRISTGMAPYPPEPCSCRARVPLNAAATMRACSAACASANPRPGWPARAARYS